MVTTPNYDLDIDTTLGGNNASDYIIPSQKAIKSYVDNNSGGGGTVDQTFDGTSANAQSGVAIAGAGFLQNIATGTNSLTLLGTATSSNLAINIGYNSSAGGGNISIGTLANTNGAGAVAIGTETEASAINTLAIGNTAKATANNAIQIGYGTNNTANKFNVRSFELLDLATGLIPDARISSNIARTSAIPTVPTNVSAFTNDAGYLTSIPSDYLQNTATATNSLTILGTTNNQNNSILIGYGTTTSSTNSTVIGNTAVSGGSYATALGYYARANAQYTTAIGNNSYANYQDVTAVGHSAQATAAGTLAVGSNSQATYQRATSIGYSSTATQYAATSLGYEAKATASGAIQIGTGTNNTANTLQVGSYTLLNTSTGLIPDARISSNIARTSDIPASEVFVAEYGTTSYVDVQTAINSGKVVFCDYNGVQCSYVQTITGTPNVAQFRYITAYTTYTINVYSNDSWEVNSTTLARTSDLSSYVQASNGNMTFANAGTEGDILYTDSTTGEFYGVVIGQSSTYGTGVTIGAGNSLAQNGYMLNLTLNGFAMIDASNMGTALLTVSNNNLAINGSEVVTGDNTRFDGQWVQSFLDLVTSAITLNTNYSNAWDISSYLPNDNYIYEVYVSAYGVTAATSGSLIDVRVGSSILKADNTTNTATAFVLRSAVRSNANRQVSNTIVIPVGTDRKLTVQSYGTGTLNTLRLLAYRRVGTNS